MTASRAHYQLAFGGHTSNLRESRRLGLSIRVLSLAIVFITALALSRVRVGPIPLYFEDLLIAAVVAVACMRSGFTRYFLTPIGMLSLCLFGFILLSECYGLAFHGSPFEPLYMMGRFGLAIALVATMPAMIRSQADLNHVLRGFVVGMLITATLAICTSLPPTRGIVNRTVFAVPMLGATVSDRALEKDVNSEDERAVRGRSLVGSINITGGVLCTVWPLAFLAYRRFRWHWKTIALWACIITPFGAMATYARGAWLGVAAILCLVFFAGYGKGRLQVLLATILATVVIGIAGVSSNLFYFDRIINKTEVAIYDRGEGENQRLYSYIEPFQLVIEYPIMLVMGSGTAGEKMARRGAKVDEMTGGEHVHSAFGKTFYTFGGVAAFCQLFLMSAGYIFIFRRLVLTRRSSVDQKLPWQVALACWLGLSPWWLFGHAIASEPRGAIIYFLMFGMLLTFEDLRLQ